MTTAEGAAMAQAAASMAMSSQFGLMSLASTVPTFDGTPRKYKRWIRDLERILLLADIKEAEKSSKLKLFALMSSKGPVRDCISRRMKDYPEENWTVLEKELKARYSPCVDSLQALAILRKAKQRPDQSVQDFVEYLRDVGYDAFPTSTRLEESIVEHQLIDVFITGLKDRNIARKLLREGKETLDENLKIAVTEQDLGRKYQVRFGSDQGRTEVKKTTTTEWVDPRHEPMDVSHIRSKDTNATKDVTCYGCHQKGNYQDGCPNKDVVCYACNQVGHYSNYCPSNPQGQRGRSRGRGRNYGRGFQPAVSHSVPPSTSGNNTHIGRGINSRPQTRGRGRGRGVSVNHLRSFFPTNTYPTYTHNQELPQMYAPVPYVNYPNDSSN